MDSTGVVLHPPSLSAATNRASRIIEQRSSPAARSGPSDWMTAAVIDPNDPRNVALVQSSHYLQLKSSASQDVDYFRLKDDYTNYIMSFGQFEQERSAVFIHLFPHRLIHVFAFHLQ